MAKIEEGKPVRQIGQKCRQGAEVALTRRVQGKWYEVQILDVF